MGVHIAYHGGRLVTYALLGLGAGWLGAAVDLAGTAAGLQRTATAMAGGIIVAWGAVALAQSFDVPLRAPRLMAKLTAGISAVWARPLRAIGRLQHRPPLVRASLIGLCSTLLPCGWLYAFAVAAAGTGSPTWGMAVMATFWVGTLPVMVGLGIGAQALGGRLRRHIPRLSAVALLLVGLLGLLGKAGPRSGGGHSGGATVDEQPPCHSTAATPPGVPGRDRHAHSGSGSHDGRH
jgi:sulfite exporter TauE/SafE